MKPQVNDNSLWQPALLQQPAFEHLNQLYQLKQLSQWPDYQWLNTLANVEHQFIDQQTFDNSPHYYEEIIYLQQQIPTRSESWHDLFNALIWDLFPQSKKSLNIQHMQDISEFGVSPRTPRRNRITHFDECGVVLAYSNEGIPEMLAQHQWHQAWVECRQQWGSTIETFIFGHANYEMLLSPFEGLTGKWLGVQVSDDFFEWSLAEQYRYLDSAVDRQIQQDIFAIKGALKPLPLLGVPGWTKASEDAGYYNNTNYFRPKPRN